MFRGLNDAWGIKCLHQFARSCFHNNEKPGGGSAYKTNAFSMISQNHMLRNVWTSTSSGTLNWSKRLMITIVFLHSSYSKSNAKRHPINKTINIPLCLHCFLEIVQNNDARTLVLKTFSKRETPVLQAQHDLFWNVAVARRRRRIFAELWGQVPANPSRPLIKRENPIT